MTFDPNHAWLSPDGNPYDGAWRDLEGVNPVGFDIELADGATDQPGTPREPIYTRLEGPWQLPWWDASEDPYRRSDIPLSPNPLPWSPNEDVGVLPRLSTYEGAFRSRGSVGAWGHEVSGGLSGDQAIGLIMRFPANAPDRFDAYGVWNTDIRDDLAAGMDNEDLPYRSDRSVSAGLLQWPSNVGGY